MAVFRKGKIWYIDYYVDGRRKREAVGPNRKLAEKVLAKRRVQLAEGRYLDIRAQSKVTFDELAEVYMKYARTNKRSWERDKYSIKRLAEKFSGGKLGKITSMALEEYKAARLKDVTPATVNRELTCLKHMFTKAIQWNMASSNPVKTIRMMKERNTRLRYLSSDEIGLLLNEISSKFRFIVVMALCTGMRRGEILSLDWSDIDIEHRVIFVRDSKNGDKREIPMVPDLVNAARIQPRGHDRVFCEDDGYCIRSLRTSFVKAVNNAGIEDFTFHDLRHTFASHMVMSGADLLTVKELLGHKSITMTLRYAHLSPDHKRKAIESLAYLDGHYMDTPAREAQAS